MNWNLARSSRVNHWFPRPIAVGKASGGVGFVVPLIAGGALAAWNPKLGMGAGSLTLVVAAVWKTSFIDRDQSIVADR